MTKKKSPWQRTAELCHAARSPEAGDEARGAAREALSCLGPVERRAFLGAVVKETPGLGAQMGKTDAELAALVTRAKRKLGEQDEPPDEAA